ncbi:MAG: sulfotransferase [Cyanobacteria bacterium HKST-UBA03]|nr:sulfotransferase [Cyanobacteria bacterium HKST-UBA03]
MSQYFCCVGAMKTGTTWLFETLFNHPDVWMSRIKEMHYFDNQWFRHKWYINARHGVLVNNRRRFHENKTLQTFIRVAQAYYNFHMNRDWMYKLYFWQRGLKPVFGELTPTYCRLPVEGFRHIQSLYPKAKIIYGMRDPYNRIVSHYNLYLKYRKKKHTMDFETFCQEPDVIEQSFYDQTLDRLYQVFDVKNVFIYYYEEAFHSPETLCALIKQLTGFLGLREHPPLYRFATQRIFPTPYQYQGERLPDSLRDQYRPTIEALIERFGRVPASWHDYGQRAMPTQQPTQQSALEVDPARQAVPEPPLSQNHLVTIHPARQLDGSTRTVAELLDALPLDSLQPQPVDYDPPAIDAPPDYVPEPECPTIITPNHYDQHPF